MNIEDYIRSIMELPTEAQSAYIQATLIGYTPSFRSNLVSVLVNHLNVIGSPSSNEFLKYRTVLEKVIANLPEDYQGSGDATRKALSAELGKVLSLGNYPMRFLVVDKLIMIDRGDPSHACQIICRLLDKGSTIEAAVYNVMLPYFRTLVNDDVDRVIDFIKETRNLYGGTAVDAFLGRLERDLQIRGLEKVWGPSLRRQYARELVQARVIDDLETSILIVGPTGTSKTFIAKRIADNSAYAELHTVNCALPKAAASELEAGIEKAHLRPISFLLDEVYALPVNLQEACLAEFGREDVALRIISTSSHSVEYLSEHLKPDFWYRIDGWRFKLHPLADSREDLEEAFRGWAADYGVDVCERIVELLATNHTWPGNHREIKRIMNSLCKICEKRKLDKLDVDLVTTAVDELDDLSRDLLKPLFL